MPNSTKNNTDNKANQNQQNKTPKIGALYWGGEVLPASFFDQFDENENTENENFINQNKGNGNTKRDRMSNTFPRFLWRGC